MTKDKPLSEKRKEWFDKWLHKRLTGRAIIELKQQDADAVLKLKEAFDILELHLAHNIDCKGCDLRIEEYKEKIEKIFGTFHSPQTSRKIGSSCVNEDTKKEVKDER